MNQKLKELKMKADIIESELKTLIYNHCNIKDNEILKHDITTLYDKKCIELKALNKRIVLLEHAIKEILEQDIIIHMFI